MQRFKYSLFSICVAIFSASCLPSEEPEVAGNEETHRKEIVAIVHGFGRTKRAMWLLAQRLEMEGYQIELVGYKSLQDPPQEILEQIKQQINSCCLDRTQKLHFVDLPPENRSRLIERVRLI